MKLALNSSTIKTTPLLEKIAVAGRAGYEGIELWAVELYEHVGRGGEISDVEKALDDHGLEVPCFIAVRNWGETAGREYQLALEEARRRFELAARFGSPLMICTPPIDRPGIEGLENGYRDLCKSAARPECRRYWNTSACFAPSTISPTPRPSSTAAARTTAAHLRCLSQLEQLDHFRRPARRSSRTHRPLPYQRRRARHTERRAKGHRPRDARRRRDRSRSGTANPARQRLTTIGSAWNYSTPNSGNRIPTKSPASVWKK